MFHDMCAPSIRIKFKVEIRKLIIKTFKSEYRVYHFFPKESKKTAVLEEMVL